MTIDYGKVVPSSTGKFFYHIGTENEYFLELSRKLKDLGVKNYQFMLILFDGELANYDVHSPNLPKEIKVRWLVEISRNPYAYLRELVRISVPGGISKFKLHLGNLAQVWAIVNKFNYFLILPRQHYKTVSAAAVYAWMFSFSNTNTHALYFNKRGEDCKNNLARTKSIIENFPEWIKNTITDKKNDLFNTEYIYSKQRNNKLETKAPPTNPKSADGLGRGCTAPILWFDELAFIKYINLIYKAATPAKAAAVESAKENGNFYGTHVTTTPNVIDDKDCGQFAYNIYENGVKFHHSFYDMTRSELENLLKEAHYNFFIIEYSYSELGKTKEWYNEQCKELLFDLLTIKRELDLKWPASNESSAFTEESIMNMKEHVLEANHRIKLSVNNQEFVIKSTEELNFDTPYIISIDTASDSFNSDNTVIAFNHPDDCRMLGYLATKSADTDLLRDIVMVLILVYFRNGVLVIERNYFGTVLVKYMLKKGYKKRMFYIIKEREGEEKTKEGRVVKSKQKTKVYGIDVTGKSREAMINKLFQLVNFTPELITNPGLQSEIRTLERDKNGKVQARSGFHDDIVMAWLNAYYAFTLQNTCLFDLIRQRQLDRHIEDEMYIEHSEITSSGGYANQEYVLYDLEKSVEENENRTKDNLFFNNDEESLAELFSKHNRTSKIDIHELLTDTPISANNGTDLLNLYNRDENDDDYILDMFLDR